MQDLAFIIISLITIISATWVVVSKNLIHSAISLLFTLFSVAGLYVFLYADFIAATQVVIYVGGILVLIIFGVMLTNKIENPSIVSESSNQIFGGLVAFFLIGLGFTVTLSTDWKISDNVSVKEETVKTIGEMILTSYLLPFEIVSVLLLAALVGAAFLSRKDS